MSEVPIEIIKARVAMSLDHPFFGYLALNLEPVCLPDMNPPTMGTDGTRLYYHPDFIKNTPPAELCGVIAHEIMHLVLDHLGRRQNREPERWNYAADYAANLLIVNEFKLPSNVLLNYDYRDKSAEYIYSHMPVNNQNRDFDFHGKWDEWEKSDKTDKQGDLAQEWRNRVAMAATQAKIQGKFPSNLESVIEELLEPKLTWKAILRDMVTSCAKSNFRLFPPNKKHINRGFYLPSITGEQINIACAIDSSGSISDESIQSFLSEVKGICDSYDDFTIHLFIADAKIQKYFELHTFDEMPRVISGRGGTDFRPVIAEAEKLDITSLVYFTDLYGSFPEQEPSIPVIWVATSDVAPPWGTVIRYEETL
jgi:predicted metal-dependent peptidase